MKRARGGGGVVKKRYTYENSVVGLGFGRFIFFVLILGDRKVRGKTNHQAQERSG